MNGHPTFKKLGIMTAMREEFAHLSRHLQGASSYEIGPRTFHEGTIYDIPVVLVCARIGKVAAATTATTLIQRCGVDSILFTGVAGGIAANVQVGDIIVARHLVQHDFDIKGLLGCGRFTIPLLDMSHLPACEKLLEVAIDASHSVRSDTEYREAIAALATREPQAHCGTIASGDIFVSSAEERTALRAGIPELLCAEMEGAAVAQVCIEHSIPYAVARVISDSANGDAHVDFAAFVERAAAVASEKFVLHFLSRQAGQRAR